MRDVAFTAWSQRVIGLSPNELELIALLYNLDASYFRSRELVGYDFDNTALEKHYQQRHKSIQ